MEAARILEFDATRGAAMAGVIVAHSSLFLLDRNGQLAWLLTTLGMVATPTFLLLSGAVCSQLSARPMHSLREVRRRLIDRGLFLLIVAHLILGATHALWIPASIALAQSFYITDAVGVCLIVAALLIQRVTRSQLVLIGGALLTASWVVSSSIAPPDGAVRVVARALVGTGQWSDDDLGWIVPAVPYLGVFLIGMAIGGTYLEWRAAAKTAAAIARTSLAIGLACASLAVALKVGALGAKPHLESDEWQRLLYFMTDPRYKIPPGPGYLLAFGGAGLSMASVIVWLTSTGLGRKAASALAVAGRASLFAFLVQYWLIAVPARVLHAQGGAAFWFVGIVLATSGVWALAAVWDAMRGNRILTLGLGHQRSAGETFRMDPAFAVPPKAGRSWTVLRGRRLFHR